MADTLDLLVLGDANPDVIVAEVGDVAFGQAEQLVERASVVIGGSGAIMACGAARLGLRVGLCAVVGDDPVGNLLVGMLEDAGLSLAHVRRDAGTPTGMSVILQRGDDRAILTAPGTIPVLGAVDLAALPDRPARHVHVASYFLMSQEYRAALPIALQRFRDSGVTISLDTNWDPSQVWDVRSVLPLVDVLLPNEAELLAITGRSDISAALREVPCDVVVKRGARGAMAWVGSEVVEVPARAAGSFVDAVGAGDSFDAGFVAGRLLGLPAGEAVRLAVATGTLSTRGAGGTHMQPDLGQARAWAVEGDAG